MFMTYDACAALGVHAHCSLPASVARSGQRYCEEPGRVWVGRAAAMVFYFTSSGESAVGGLCGFRPLLAGHCGNGAFPARWWGSLTFFTVVFPVEASACGVSSSYRTEVSPPKY